MKVGHMNDAIITRLLDTKLLQTRKLQKWKLKTKKTSMVLILR